MIYLGSDHGGFDVKEKIKKWLTEWGYDWEDLGNTYYDRDDDYPIFARLIAEKVASEEKKIDRYQTLWKDRPKGVICCRSAAGMVIAANKVKGARCATAFNLRSAKHSRAHNDVNILALSGDWLEDYQAKKILAMWLETDFTREERHVRRLRMIEQQEN